MRILGKLAALGFGAFVLLQLVRPGIPVPAATAELKAPESVKRILEKNCYSCHSNQRRLAWFDEIVPAYWLVRHDILTARDHLNFSSLGGKPAAAQKAALYEAVNMIRLGAMPLLQFRMLHPEANVSAEELASLKSYLAPWTTPPEPLLPASPTRAVEEVAPASAQPEFNGLALDPTYKSWKALSFTDRGDNNTFRFILGNEAAVRAVQTGKISPWPDGAKIAKIAFQKAVRADGLVFADRFIQVELMQKGAHAYWKTAGWAWGRWRGEKLKPYGKDAQFVKECTSCHLPVRGNDDVYTLPVTNAPVAGQEVVNNRAALPAHLPHQPFNWYPASMYVDPASQSTAILFLNDLAQQSSALNSSKAADPPGSVLALVTWSQREDPHWFGARIPNNPRSVEFVSAGSADPTAAYVRYAGTGLTRTSTEKAAALKRVRFILDLPRIKLP